MHVYFPSGAVAEPVDVSFTVVPEAKLELLPTTRETLVSNVVRIEPENMEFNEEVIISLMHCSTTKTLGYENVIKVLDTNSQTWVAQAPFANLDCLGGKYVSKLA